MTDTPKPLDQWHVILTDGTSKTVRAHEFEIDGGDLMLFINNEQTDVFLSGTWVSVHRVRREK